MIQAIESSENYYILNQLYKESRFDRPSSSDHPQIVPQF